MSDPPAGLRTARLVLRPWRPEDRGPFAVLNADPEVMAYFPAPLTRVESDALATYCAAGLIADGFGVWALEVPGCAAFVGFVGLARATFAAPFTPDIEIGWRLDRRAWGRGYATEAATAVLADGFDRVGLTEIVSFTTVTNTRSRAVMTRLGMHRDPAEDFEHPRLVGHPLAPHVLFRLRADEWRAAAERPT